MSIERHISLPGEEERKKEEEIEAQQIEHFREQERQLDILDHADAGFYTAHESGDNAVIFFDENNKPLMQISPKELELLRKLQKFRQEKILSETDDNSESN